MTQIMPLYGRKIIDFKVVGTVDSIQGKGWTFNQSEESNAIIKKQLNCEESLKEDFDTFFMNEDEEILCMSNTVPYDYKQVWAPVFEE